VDPGRRRELTRFGAPAAFLAAVTIAVLLIKAGLNNGSEAQPTTVGAQPTTATTRTQAQTTTKLVLTTPAGTLTTTTATTTPAAQYYVIQSGDTLGSIAEKYSTTVDELMTLNPGVDSTALQPGDRIRVG
jgi:LysM repeat protein